MIALRSPQLVLLICAASAWLAAGPFSMPTKSLAQGPADIVLRGGSVLTLEDDRPTASAVAIRGDRIAWVGSTTQAERWIGSTTRVIELDGRTVMPGFIESHGHFIGLGRSLMSVDLTGAQDYAEVVARVAKAVAAAQPGDWIVGRGWHQEKWHPAPEPNVEGYPLHTPLSRISPNNPVLLTHATGHMSLANANAMKLAGITAATPDPPGGTILRGRDGNPTGVFRENAMGPLYAAHQRAENKKTPQRRRAELLRAIELAGQACLRHGVTTFHDAGTSFGVVDIYRQLAGQDALPVRLYVMLNAGNPQLAERMAAYRCVGAGKNFLTVRSVKRMADGALGSHGALMLEPYDDLPTSTGLQTLTPKSLQETARLCLKHNFQLCVHAIGDRANREILDLYQDAFQQSTGAKQLRWRIEHAQHLAAEDIPRFAQLGVIASMQGIHATSDGPFVVTRLGPRRARIGAYAWRSLIDTGAMIANGTDVPVEPIAPLACLYASTTRKLNNGVAFFPEQRMTRQEALESYTINGAFAAFEEQLKGSITPGKLADLVVLSGNPLTCRTERLPHLQVEITILAGKIAHQATVKK